MSRDSSRSNVHVQKRARESLTYYSIEIIGTGFDLTPHVSAYLEQQTKQNPLSPGYGGEGRVRGKPKTSFC
mgnify:CR=1 FL=1